MCERIIICLKKSRNRNRTNDDDELTSIDHYRFVKYLTTGEADRTYLQFEKESATRRILDPRTS